MVKKMTLGDYPFGLKHRGYNNVVSSNGNSVAQKFGYSGKELNEELGLDWYDFGWRNFDASLGRWMNIDPMAEKYYDKSSYVYTLNNPVFFVDPDGREVDVTSLVKGEGGEDDLWILVQLMLNLSEMSGEAISYDTDNKGKSILVSKGCGNTCKSDEASSYVNHLLSSEKTAIVKSTKTGSRAEPTTNEIFLDAGQIFGVMTALENEGEDSDFFNTGMMFLHETLHTEVGADYFTSDEDKKDKINYRGKNVFPDPQGNARATQSGPTVDRVNS